MVCINVIVRKPWTEQEKLAYPIIQLPFRMTSEGFFRNKHLWLAFTLTATFDIVNGLHLLFPSIPSIFEKSVPVPIRRATLLSDGAGSGWEFTPSLWESDF